LHHYWSVMFNTKEEIYYSVIFTSIFFCLLIGIIIYAAFLYEKRKKKHLLDRNNFNNILLSSQIEIQEQTLQHLSRELHDNLGQVASLIKINLTTLQLSDTAKASEKVEATKELTRQLIADIKSLSVSLGSDRLAQTGLAKAIETEVERLNKTGEFIATCELQGAMPDIDADKTLILYRMAQEVLNNMVKHSEARHINILLHVNENVFILAFSDDGIGFNAEEKITASGAGLRNLQSRALLINAQLHIESVPGNGTCITIGLPL
jgi:signal transduction histidine kinase